MAAPPGFNGRTEMFKDEVTAVGNAAKGKINLLEHNFTGILCQFFMSSGLFLWIFTRTSLRQPHFLQ